MSLMIIDSTIYVDEQELQEREWRKLFAALAFTDANDYVVECWDYHRNGVRIPRGARYLLPERLDVRDLRSRPAMRTLHFDRVLDSQGYARQQEAVEAMLREEQGQVIRPPGSGKTNIGLAFAAACQTRTLVVVHTRTLLRQWLAEAASALPDAELGVIAGDKFEVGEITIATAQTLKRYLRDGRGFWGRFGALLIDEEHHAAAETWEWILNTCPAYYRFGLTATEKRADGRDPLVRFLLGLVIHRTPFESPYPLSVVPVSSGHRAHFGPLQYTSMIRDLVEDEQRNARIAKVALEQIRSGRSVIVLSEQIKHLELISAELEQEADKVALLTGNVPGRRAQQMLDRFRAGEIRCLLATRIFDEGADVPIIDRVILSYPGKHSTPLIQRIGRSVRLHPGKDDVVIYDIVDEQVPTFRRQFAERKVVYRALGASLAKPMRDGDVGTKERRSLREVAQNFRVKKGRHAA